MDIRAINSIPQYWSGPMRYMFNTWLRGILPLPWCMLNWDTMQVVREPAILANTVFSEKMRIRYESASNRGMALARMYTFFVDQYTRTSLNDIMKYTFPETVDYYWRNMRVA